MEFAALLGFEVVCLVDNNPTARPVGVTLPFVVGLEGLESYLTDHRTEELFGLAAIGGMKGKDRLQIHEWFRGLGIRIPTLVHPACYVAHGAQIDEGAQVLAGAVIGVDAHIGPATIVNTRASVDHDCEVGAGVHIAPGATVAGEVRIGSRSFIGPGAVISSRIALGEDVIIGAGAVVTRNVPDGVVAYGVPARIIRPS
jgi:sugar O-acyltransferase (sialic acid O-acetyltransferase NeuD family)